MRQHAHPLFLTDQWYICLWFNRAGTFTWDSDIGSRHMGRFGLLSSVSLLNVVHVGNFYVLRYMFWFERVFGSKI
jgi:hypothetical protein